jgi:Icc-related predicted phosphoesterase
MLFGALGDIHGDFDSVDRIMRSHPEVSVWVSVGDLADEGGGYRDVPAPLYWIKGNNEQFDAIAEGRLASNLHYLRNGSLTDLGGVRVAALGGTLAPTWYETAAADLPHPKKGSARATELADKRRHFVREEVEACKAMRGVDLLMTHEAPRPYRVGKVDAGKTPINEVLAGMQPRLHLFGHHHRFSEQVRQGVRSVGLDVVSQSYLLIDAETMEYRLV